MMGRPMSDVKVVGHGDNTSVSLIHVDREGNFSVEYMNDGSHLPPELRRAWSGVAGADINMAVDPVDLDKESEVLEELARAHARQTEERKCPLTERSGWHGPES